MIIKEIELENFRSHAGTKIAFDRGITLILGENGAGKTSILEAINFALFKEKSSNLKIEELITSGRKKMKVSIKFLSDGKEYGAVKTRESGGKAEDTLYEIKDGKQKILCRGEKETKNEIERILKISTKVFSNAVYIKQGEIDKFLFLEPGEKKEYIGRLLGTGALEAAWERMQQIINNYGEKKASLEGVPEMIKEVSKKLEEEKAEISSKEEVLKKLELETSKKKELIKNLEEKEKKVEEICRIKSEKEKLALEKKALEEKLEKLDEYEKKFQSTKEIYEKYKKLEQELEELNKLRYEHQKNTNFEKDQQKLTSLIGKSLEISKKINKIKTQLKEKLNSEEEDAEKLKAIYREERELAEKNKLSLRNEIERIASERGNLQSSVKNLENSIKTLEGAESACPVCNSPLTEEHKSALLEEYAVKRKEYEAKLKLLEIKERETKRKEKEAELKSKALQEINLELLSKLAEDKKEVEDEIKKIKEEKEKNKSLLLELEKLKKQGEEKNKEKENLEHGRNEHIAAKDYLENEQRNKESYLKQVEKLSAVIEEHMKTINESSIPEEYAETELKNLKIQLKKERNEFLIFEKEKSSNEAQIKEKKKSIENLKKEIDNLKQKEKEHEKLEKFITLLERIRELFHKDALQKELRARAKPIIEKHAREVFANFELPFNDLRIDDDFNVFLYSSRGEERAEMLSGGERIALALAMRIALSKTLLSKDGFSSGMEMLMLDEPTIHLDEQRRKELVEIIKRINYIPQTIIVTHDSDFESSAEKRIFVEKEGGMSKVRN